MSPPLHFEIVLLEDAVLRSPAGRRSGGGPGLDYVPGSALLGVAARRYREVAPELAWDLFHSGRVRYGDARPVEAATGAPAVPAPLSLHVPKGPPADSLRALDIRDFTRVPRVPGYRPVEALVGPGGTRIAAHTRQALRTAVDFASERASEGQLFAYEAVAAGTRLRFTVEIDPEADRRELRDFLLRAFDGHAQVGRSRSAEHGQASFAHLPAADAPPWPAWPLAHTLAAGRLTLWCISDLELLDPGTGAPTMQPDPEHFGLPGTLDAERTFIRPARWTPFNGHRARPDRERIALRAGSVITFTGLPADFDLPAFRARAARGFGAHRAEGLGRVLVHPRLFEDVPAGLVSASAPARPAAASPPLPQDDLGRWLAPRVARATADQSAFKAAEEAYHDAFFRFTRRPGAPTRSQWNAVRELARRHAGDAGTGARDRLHRALFGEAADGARGGLCVHGTVRKRWFPGRPGQAGERLQAFLAARADAEAPLAVGYLADRMVKGLQAEENTREEQGGAA